MITLESFRVQGLKSLSNLGDIPVRSPTIITGANDGGKSSTLQALDFLLGGETPSVADYTTVGATNQDGDQPLRTERVTVEGTFRLSPTDMSGLSLEEVVFLRRIAGPQGESYYELRASQPVDARLRGIDSLKLADLKELANELALPPSGRSNLRESWLGPLRSHIGAQPFEDAWISAPRELVERLPAFTLFSSTDEPDPEAQIRKALHAAFRELLDDDELVGPVRDVEEKVRAGLATRAQSLCEHVRQRCPELSEISVVPDIKFSEGFRSVQIVAARPQGAGIPLNQSGAGRRRRINLAVWEWTGEILTERSEADHALIIGYDEPDTHLDYGHQRELVSLIRKQCLRPGVRMLVATHSLNLIDRVAIEDVVHLRLVDERTVVERLVAQEHEDIQQYLASVSEAMGLRNSVLLHERCFVGVEGPTEMQAFPVLFRLATGMSLQSAGIALISGNGNDGALRVVEFLKKHGRRLAFVLVDSDSSESKLFGEDKLKSAGVEENEIRYVGVRELEDLFSDVQWAEVAEREWRRTDGRPWSPDDFSALRSSPKFSKAVADMVREQSSTAPQGKPGYLTALVQGLKASQDVPEPLTSIFEDLVELAAT